MLGLLGSAAADADEPAPIEDNSFLIEEAYNQEPGVVQHINTWSRERHGGWIYTFVQEWPVGSQKHQLSYSLPWLELRDGVARESRLGEVLVNYRFQAVGGEGGAVAFAPRFSLLLPTADEDKGLGTGAVGVQGNLPLSVVLGKRFVSHVNLGATYVPDAKNVAGEEANLSTWSFGQSYVWLVRSRFNALVELVYGTVEVIEGPGATRREDLFLINPGVRWAHDLSGGLQIVPGVAATFGLGPSRGEQALFVYLSFEHAFR